MADDCNNKRTAIVPVLLLRRWWGENCHPNPIVTGARLAQSKRSMQLLGHLLGQYVCASTFSEEKIFILNLLKQCRDGVKRT